MRYYAQDGKRIKYNLFSMLFLHLHFVGMGEEGVVFRENDRVVKFYHPTPMKPVLDVETATILTNINTSRILLPESKKDSLLFSKEGSLVGYKSTYIKNLGIKNLLNLDIHRFKEETMLLRKDVSVLSEHHITIEDLQFQNFVFNNGIYFVDIGSFEISQEEIHKIYEDNMDKLSEGLLEILYYGNTYLETDVWRSMKKINGIYRSYLESDYSDAVDFVNEEIHEETLGKYLIKK